MLFSAWWEAVSHWSAENSSCGWWNICRAILALWFEPGWKCLKDASVCVCVCVCAHACALSHSVVSNSLQLHGLCSPSGSSVHVILQVRILEWGAIFSSRGSSWPRDRTCISWISRWILHHWATRKDLKRLVSERNKGKRGKWGIGDLNLAVAILEANYASPSQTAFDLGLISYP